ALERNLLDARGRGVDGEPHGHRHFCRHAWLVRTPNGPAHFRVARGTSIHLLPCLWTPVNCRLSEPGETRGDPRLAVSHRFERARRGARQTGRHVAERLLWSVRHFSGTRRSFAPGRNHEWRVPANGFRMGEHVPVFPGGRSIW